MSRELERERVRFAALRLLRYRERSVSEMRDRLRRKRFDREIIESEIGNLINQKLLDDERFTGVWIRHKLTVSRKGMRLIRAELAAKGIRSEMFNRVWAEYVEAEITSACKYAASKISKFSLLSPYERRSRIRQMLYRRGYSPKAITKALKEIE